LGGVRRRGHIGDWNVCSVLVPLCIEQAFDVKQAEARIDEGRDTLSVTTLDVCAKRWNPLLNRPAAAPGCTG
jgi:hypothetical protein